MATFDILSVTVRADGWTADVEMDALTGEQGNVTYDFGIGPNNDPTNATFKLEVFPEGFDEFVGSVTAPVTVYGTKAVRLPSPNQADLDETETGIGNMTIRVSLSKQVYQPIAGGDIATIEAGWAEITSGPRTGDTSTAFSDLSFTNSSSVDPPKVIGNWAWPGSEVVNEDIPVEFADFHKFAGYGGDGKQIACLKFEAVDEHANFITPILVTEMVKSDRGEANCVQIYKATIPVSGFTDGDIITVKATAYPWVGGNDAVLNTDDGVNTFPTALYTNQFYRYNTGTHGHCVVDSSSTEVSAQVYASQALAEAGGTNTQYATIAAALTALQSYHNGTTSPSHNDAGGGNIYLTAETHFLDSTNGGTLSEWVTVKPLSGVTKAQAILQAPGANDSMPTYLKTDGITVSGVGYWRGFNTKSLWMHDCALDTTGAWTVFQFNYNNITFCTGSIGDGFNGSTAANGTGWGVIRGNDLTLTTYNFSACTTVLGNNGIAIENTSITAETTNRIFAYNTYYNYTDDSNPLCIFDSTDVDGLAIVQNVFENSTTAQPLLRISADGTTTTTNNVLLFYNTFVGQRVNMGYNDTVPVSGPFPQDDWREFGNNYDNWNNKDDTFGNNFAATGGWPVGYHVSGNGNVFSSSASDEWFGEFIGLNSIKGTTATPLAMAYLDDKSAIGSGEGNGDYHLTADSPGVGLLMEILLPYDIEGTARFIDSATNGGAAGAYEFGSAPGPSEIVSLLFNQGTGGQLFARCFIQGRQNR